MPAIVTNESTETFLRQFLIEKGYNLLNGPKGVGETGVDIIAEKENNTYYIEVIGYKSSPPARSKDFFEVFFRAVSRLNEGIKHCIIAMPINFKTGLPQRVFQYKIAWQRIGKAFPELEIWLVDIQNKSIEQTNWNHWSE